MIPLPLKLRMLQQLEEQHNGEIIFEGECLFFIINPAIFQSSEIMLVHCARKRNFLLYKDH